MWNTNNLKEQVNDVLSQYPQLTVDETDSNQIRLYGTINVNRSACNYTLQKNYLIEILLPDSYKELPKIKSVDNCIDKSYPHQYKDGTLCLETDGTVKLRFIDNFNLIEWMDEYVEPYFFSYEYFSRFGFFPFGERSHGFVGIIESYQDIFNEKDLSKTYSLLEYASENIYHGHVSCPCGSGLRLRKCHGTSLFPYMTDIRKKRILQEDLNTIRKEIIAIELQRRDSKKTKQR